MNNKKNLKSGMTLISLVIYVVLFSTFTIFVSNITTNLNENLFDSRGEAINCTNLNKLQYNLENSALESDSVLISDVSIYFSNGDNYIYDINSKCILKNDGILCQNVNSFSAVSSKTEDVTKIQILVTAKRYLNEMNRTIICSVEEF